MIFIIDFIAAHYISNEELNWRAKGTDGLMKFHKKLATFVSCLQEKRAIKDSDQVSRLFE